MPIPETKVFDLPFDEAIDHFKKKVKLPSKTWEELWQGMHARGFVIAGAMKTQLVSDLYEAVEKGITDGTTIAQFREDFDDIIKRHGWKYKGGKGWRTSVIFNTNIKTAYAAGHYKQMFGHEVLKARPFLRYVASNSRFPRPEHVKWYNLILPAGDSFWKTHYPPNGWGCKCGIVNHSAREVEKIKKEEAGGQNPVKTKAPKIEHYDWKSKKTGKIHKIPKGIDPGWDYNIGEASWGKQLSSNAMDAWKAQGAKQWEKLTAGDWQSAGRPEQIPVDAAKAKIGAAVKGTGELESRLKTVLGADEKIFTFVETGLVQTGFKPVSTFRYDVLVNAEVIAKHIPADRASFVPFLTELMHDPFEVWLSFERHKGTGRIVLRQRIIKAVKLKKNRGLLMVAQSVNGIMESSTMIPVRSLTYLNNQRQGKLIWARQE